jgi:hypothetical protein
MGGALLYLIPYLSNVHSKYVALVHCRICLAQSCHSCGIYEALCAPLLCRMTYYILAALCLLIGASTTHGLAGPLRHKVSAAACELYRQYGATCFELLCSCRKVGTLSRFKPAFALQATAGWQFWQPFQGGTAFVATQAAGWALTAASLASMLWIGRQASPLCVLHTRNAVRHAVHDYKMCTAFSADCAGCGACHLALAGGDLGCHAAGTSGTAAPAR